jgi:Sigma-70, region 4
MSRLDELPPDQRAALSLILRRGKSYAELAAVLGISERAVHDRAHAALAVLAPRQARDVAGERREEIGEYLLGQQRGVAERLATRTFLGGSEPGRAWATRLAGELAPLASEPLPDIPAGSRPAPAARNSHPPDGSTQSPQPLPDAGGAPPAVPPRGAGRPSSLPSSRLGGALLLAGIAAAVVIAILLLSGGGSHAKSASGSSTSASGGAKASSTTTGPTVSQRLTLRSPNASSSTIAAVEILTEAGKRAFYMAAEHLPPSKGFYYGIWLSSPTGAEELSKSPAVGANERLAGGALLPANAANFNEMLVTRETSSRPSRPGTIVLQGAFSLGG